LKESIFFLYLKTGFSTPDVVLSVTKIELKYSRVHPAPLPSENEQRLENEHKKSYRILISSCWTTDIRLFHFYRKRGLGPDQSHYNQSRLSSRLQTTL